MDYQKMDVFSLKRLAKEQGMPALKNTTKKPEIIAWLLEKDGKAQKAKDVDVMAIKEAVKAATKTKKQVELGTDSERSAIMAKYNGLLDTIVEAVANERAPRNVQARLNKMAHRIKFLKRALR